ncbi:MAG: heme-binding protein [Bacilli bacterium]|nr:heme-binding protein [Bacilli bacterium]MBN2696223.1 heme-binding protein [Bacilli bacterium]
MALFETMKFKLIKKDKNIEIREYKDILLASTKTQKNQKRDSGFNNVFSYISGNNDRQEKISMTTPVVTYEAENELVTGFYVPSKYDKTSIPQPKGSDVFIAEMEASIYAVIKFRGRWTDENFQKHDKILKDYLKEKGDEILSHRLILRYQPPIVPSIFRRNEIAYQIKTKS